jgi:hypothetical protein
VKIFGEKKKKKKVLVYTVCRSKASAFNKQQIA